MWASSFKRQKSHESNSPEITPSCYSNPKLIKKKNYLVWVPSELEDWRQWTEVNIHENGDSYSLINSFWKWMIGFEKGTKFTICTLHIRIFKKNLLFNICQRLCFLGFYVCVLLFVVKYCFHSICALNPTL